jgi:concanavalin A-like lectin/glucanase superfamily protein
MARDFPGSGSNFLSVGDVAAIDITGTALTLHAWVNPDSVTNDGGIIAKWSGLSGGNQYLLLMGTDGKLQGQVRGSAADIVNSVTVLTTGRWYPVGLRKNGTGAGALSVWIDGINDASVTSNQSIQNTSTGLEVGRAAISNTLIWDGKLCEAAIWNAALSDGEMLALGRGVSPVLIRPTNLKGYWPIWAVAGPEADLSGNVNNLTVTGTIPLADHAPVEMPFPQPVYFETYRTPPNAHEPLIRVPTPAAAATASVTPPVRT